MLPILFEFDLFGKDIVVGSYFVFNLFLNPLIFIIFAIFYLHRLTGKKVRSVFTAFIVTGIVLFGARLFWYLGVITPQTWKDINPFQLYSGRFTMVGGFVFLFIFMPLLVKYIRVDYWSFLDALTPGWALGIGFNKIGCFLNGCCIGIETDSIFGMNFPMIDYPNPVFPTQLYESISGFVGFTIVMLIRRSRTVDGLSFSFFAFYFAVVRFLLHFIKEVPPSMEMPPFILTISYTILVLITGYLLASRILAYKNSKDKLISI